MSSRTVVNVVVIFEDVRRTQLLITVIIFDNMDLICNLYCVISLLVVDDEA